VGRTLFPAVKEAETEIKQENTETSAGEFQSSDADITNTPGHLPTEEKNPSNQVRPTNHVALEPTDESAVASATPIESTNLNESSSTAKNQIDPESSWIEGNDPEEAEGGAGREGEWTSIQGGGNQGRDDQGRDGQGGHEANDHTEEGGIETSPTKRQKTDSEEASERGDTVESINEGWQDVGAASVILGAGREHEGNVGVGEGAGETGKTEGAKAAFILPVLSENRDTYEDVQRRVAEAKEKRAAAGAGQADAVNRLGKDW
jgi:hypothetical protein